MKHSHQQILEPILENDIDVNHGLTLEQIVHQQQIYGKNDIISKKQVPLFIKFLKFLIEPMMLLLVLAGFIALGIAIYGIASPSAHHSGKVEIIISFVEPFVIWFIVILNAVFGTLQENKAEKSINALEKLTSPNSKVLRDGHVIVIPSYELTVGDILIIEAGDQITGDGLILESQNLEVDESLLTGESLPSSKNHLAIVENNAPLGDRLNLVFSGTSVTYGHAKILIRAIGMKTEIGKISELINNEKDHLTPLQQKVNKLGKWIGIGAAILCILTFIIYLLIVANIINTPANFGLYWHTALIVSITLAIGTVPEGLVPIITVILSMGIKRLSKKNALVKKISSAETLGSVSIICSDKTGTLTKNKMTVTKIWLPNSGYAQQLTDQQNQDLLVKASLCTDGQMSIIDGKINLVGDPTETSLLEATYNLDQKLIKTNLVKLNTRVGGIPFDSDRKMMSVIIKQGQKYLLITKGAPDAVFSRLKSNKNLDTYHQINDQMGHQALRVLAFAIKILDKIPENFNSASLEKDLELIGLVGIIDPPREEAKVAIAQTKKAGIRTIMITGDHANTAGAIARQLGILEAGQEVITSQQLASISDEQLFADVEKYSVYARVSPSDKIRIVKAWQSKDKIVSMTGDGVNDAPALKASDIGCAMGITGTDVSKQAADMILTDDNFATIANAVKEGRELLDNIKRLMVFLFTSNLAAMLTTFLGIIIFAINPLSALQILWINVISETFPGIALGMNRSKAQLMNQKPLNKKAPIVSSIMLTKILVSGIFICSTSLFMYYLGASSFYSFDFSTTKNAIASSTILEGQALETVKNAQHFGSSLAFLTLGLCLSFNAIIVRSQWSIFQAKWRHIQLLIIALIASLIVIGFVVFMPGVNLLFNMNPYVVDYQWLLAIPFIIALVFILTIEISKLFLRKNKN